MKCSVGFTTLTAPQCFNGRYAGKIYYLVKLAAYHYMARFYLKSSAHFSFHSLLLMLIKYGHGSMM